MARPSSRPQPARGHAVPVESLESRRLLHSAAHDPVMLEEHQAVMALVPDAAVTHAAVRSGPWSAPATWAGGVVPAAEANVLVPANVSVTVDGVNAVALRTVRVDGTLKFATAADTQLTVDTMVVTPNGSLVIGTAAEPVAPGVTARVVFADRGPIDTAWDPLLFSRGLIDHGTTSIFGAAKTGFVPLSGPALKGARMLALARAPQNWAAGDELVIPGTSASGNQDETVTVVGVAGRFVRVDRPLAWTHAAPQPDLPVYVADVSRNVVFSSQNQAAGAANVARRGHVMFMHSPDADLHYAAFEHLGRTDKSVRINDPVLDADHRLVPGTGANPRGRYALHFHRTGIDPATAAHVSGSVVSDGVGWGFVNHSSDVLFEDNVSYNVTGAGFVTESGDEVGAFRHNFALRSAGSGGGIESRRDVQDFGHGGHGFWFQGGGVEVEDNIAAGHAGGAFVYLTRGLVQAGLGTTRFAAANLADRSIAGGADTLDVGDVPIRLFRNNYAFASADGFESWFHLLNATHAGRSTVDGFTTWGNRTGRALFVTYTRHMTLHNVRALGNMHSPWGWGIQGNDATTDINVSNSDIEGFEVGVFAPKRGVNAIRGGLLNNVQNVYVATAAESGRAVDIGAVRFGRLSAAALNGKRQYDVYFEPGVLAPAVRDLTAVFGDDTVRLNGPQVYRREQAATFVPYPAGAGATPAYVPAELAGKTNRQLWDEYHLAVGGAVAPPAADDFGRPRTNGLVGERVAHLPALALASRKYVGRLSGYSLVYTLAGGRPVQDPLPADLHEGWNLLTRTVGQVRRTFLVYGDTTAPAFLPQRSPLVVNPLALSRGFTVEATIADDSIGPVVITRTFTGLSQRPVQRRADGSRFITLEFATSDLAGNGARTLLELTLDDAAPL